MNARRAALRIFSGKIIYNRVMPGGLRTARHCVFTGGAVAANGICGAAFCESAAQRLVSSPSPSLLRKSTSPKGRGLGKKMKFAWTAKGSHFGGAGIA